MCNMKTNRVGETNYNKAGQLMKLVEYDSTLSIVIEFQDEFKTRVKSQYQYFKQGKVLNPSDKKRCRNARPIKRTMAFYENYRSNNLKAIYV